MYPMDLVSLPFGYPTPPTPLTSQVQRRAQDLISGVGGLSHAQFRRAKTNINYSTVVGEPSVFPVFVSIQVSQSTNPPYHLSTNSRTSGHWIH